MITLNVLGTCQYWMAPWPDCDEWLAANFKGCGASVAGKVCGSKDGGQLWACPDCAGKNAHACMEAHKVHEAEALADMAKNGNAIQRAWCTCFSGLVVSTTFVRRMTAKDFAHVNHDSAGLKAVCKHLGIKFTRKAIQAFLDAEAQRANSQG